VEVPASRWPDLVDDLEPEGLQRACHLSEDYLRALPPDLVLSFGTWGLTAVELADGVGRLRDLLTSRGDRATRDRTLREEFVLLQSVGGDGRGEVLFTAYYEPVIEARRNSEAPFVHPVWALPEDRLTIDLEEWGFEGDRKLVGRLDGRRVVPYHDREAIDFGDGLAGPAEPLAWVADPVDVFFLHVQGSGTLTFPSGERLRVGYAGSNGHPYRSIGKLLLDEGVITREEMSMQAIRAFLDDHPEEVRRVLTYNPSYVFFRPLEPRGGPLGCYEVELTPGRSIATDRRLFPAPVVAFIQGALPTADGLEAPLSRFVLNQDTGGAIRGPGRLDLFIGTGDEAGEVAGRTKHPGRLYFLLPRR